MRTPPLLRRALAPILWGVALASLFGLPMIWIYWVSVYGPRYWAIPGVDLFVLPLLVATLLGLASLPLMLINKARPLATTTAVACLSFFVASIAFSHLADQVRRSGFVRLSHSARPLVDAINEYADVHGHPPQSLDELPETVRKGLPDFTYQTGPEAQRIFDGNPWVLTLDTATGLINWDQFFYYPLQNYPRYGLGGSIECIEDWAYVHE